MKIISVPKKYISGIALYQSGALLTYEIFASELRGAEGCASIHSNLLINPSPVLWHLSIHSVQSILKMQSLIDRSWRRILQTTHSSTALAPADDPGQLVLICIPVLHSERTPTISVAGVLSRCPRTHHVARDLASVATGPCHTNSKYERSDRVAGCSFTESVGHYGHWHLLKNRRWWREARISITPTWKSL